MSEGDYPLGAKYDKNAPYNQEPPKEKEVEVCVSVTYHKSMKIICPEHYGEEEIKMAAEVAAYKDCAHMEECGWTEDEFEVIKE